MNVEKCLKQTIFLLNCLIKNTTAEISREEIDLKELFSFAEMHKVANMLYPVLKRAGIAEDEDSMRSFKERYYSAIIMETQQNNYLEIVEKAFEEAGIIHMPMKGSVIKYLYPERSLRTATDVDLYIGKKEIKRTQGIMQELGFVIEVCDSEVSNHDTYIINNRHCFELHYELMPRTPYFKGCEVCDELEKNIQKDENSQFGRHMSVEDFYVYMIIHIAKHIKHNGMGIRGFLDVAIYLNKYKESMEFDRVEDLLERSSLTQFHDSVVQLVELWFCDKTDVEEHIKELALHIAKSGVMGTEQQVVSEELYKDTATGKKKRYYIQTVFLPIAYMKDKYKILRKFPVLLPVCWVHRVIYVCLFKRKNIRKMMNHFVHADIDMGKKSFELKERIGL